jgi:hypothetical protein
MWSYLVRKKKPAKPEPKKPAEKPAGVWTTEEAMDRLFPKPLVNVVRHDLEHPRKPRRPSMTEE